MGITFIRRVLHPLMLIHFILWAAALALTVIFFGRLWPGRLYDVAVLCFGVLSLNFIVWYWVKGLPGLYGLLVTYIGMGGAAMVAAANHLGLVQSGLNWFFAVLLMLLPIFEVYNLIVSEKEQRREVAGVRKP